MEHLGGLSGFRLAKAGDEDLLKRSLCWLETPHPHAHVAGMFTDGPINYKHLSII